MAIPKNKLNGEKDRAVIEVINVKIPQEEGESSVERKVFIPPGI